MTPSTRTHFSTLRAGQHGRSGWTHSAAPCAPVLVFLPAPEHQQTPWRRGGDAAWCWSLPETGAADVAMLSQRLPVRQHRRPEEACRGHARGAPFSSITASLAVDQRRLSAHLDRWAYMLRQRLAGQQPTAGDGAQLAVERQAQRRRLSGDGSGCTGEQAERPVPHGTRAAILRGGGAGGTPQAATVRGRQGNDLPAAAALVRDGVPTRCDAEAVQQRRVRTCYPSRAACRARDGTLNAKASSNVGALQLISWGTRSGLRLL